MAKIDLENMPLEELKQFQEGVGKAIKSFEAGRKADARAAAETAAREMGFRLAELTDGKSTKPAASPKYRHPENPALP